MPRSWTRRYDTTTTDCPLGLPHYFRTSAGCRFILNLGLSFFWTTLDLMSFAFVSEDSVLATRVSSDVEPLSAVRLLIILDLSWEAYAATPFFL